MMRSIAEVMDTSDVEVQPNTTTCNPPTYAAQGHGHPQTPQAARRKLAKPAPHSNQSHRSQPSPQRSLAPKPPSLEAPIPLPTARQTQNRSQPLSTTSMKNMPSPRPPHGRPSPAAPFDRPCRPPTPEYAMPQDCAFPPFPGYQKRRKPAPSSPASSYSSYRERPAPNSRPSTATRTTSMPTPTKATSSAPNSPSSSRPGLFQRLFSSSKKGAEPTSSSASSIRSYNEASMMHAHIKSAPSTPTVSPSPPRPSPAQSMSDRTINTLTTPDVPPIKSEDASNVIEPASPLPQLRTSSNDPDLNAHKLDEPANPTLSSNLPQSAAPSPASPLTIQTQGLGISTPGVPLRSPLRPTASVSEEINSATELDAPEKSTGEMSPAVELLPQTPVLNSEVQRAPQLLLAMAALKSSLTSSNNSTSSADTDYVPDSPSSYGSRNSMEGEHEGSTSTAYTSYETSPQMSKESLNDHLRPSGHGNERSDSDSSLGQRSFRGLSTIQEQPLSTQPKEGLLQRPQLISRVTNSPRGGCRGCGMEIVGKSIKAADGRLTGRYHKECFNCRVCEASLDGMCYVLDDQAYCAHDYHILNNSLCGSCNKGIEGQYLETQPGKKHHVDCFVCSDCKHPLLDSYFEINDAFYCDADASRRFEERTSLDGAGKNDMERRKTRLFMV